MDKESPVPDPSHPLADAHPLLEVRNRTPKFLVLIGISKLLKATFLMFAGFAVLHFMNHDIGLFVKEWADRLRLDPGGPLLRRFVAGFLAIDHRTLWLVSIGMFVYSTLYGIEGIGLLLDKTWAEWMTVVTTAGFIPLEIYEICRHPTGARIGLLAFNVVILVYLIYYVRRKIKRHHEERHVREQETAAAKEKSLKGNV